MSGSLPFLQYAPGFQGPNVWIWEKSLACSPSSFNASPFFPGLQPGSCSPSSASKLKACKSSPKTLVSFQTHKPVFAFPVSSCRQWCKGQSLQRALEHIPGILRDPVHGTTRPRPLSPQPPPFCTSAWQQALLCCSPYPAILHSAVLHSKAP